MRLPFLSSFIWKSILVACGMLFVTGLCSQGIAAPTPSAKAQVSKAQLLKSKPVQTPSFASTITEVDLERDDWEEWGPTCKLVLRRNGTVDYEGVRAMSRLGSHHGHLDPGTFEVLTHLLQSLDFVGMDKQYAAARRSGVEGTRHWVTVWSNGHKFLVSDSDFERYPYPYEKYWALTSTIEKLLDEIEWQDEDTGIRGVVRDPLLHHEGAGLIIRTQDKNRMTLYNYPPSYSYRTEADGHFEVMLPPGQYIIEVGFPDETLTTNFHRNQFTLVTVRTGQMSELVITYDAAAQRKRIRDQAMAWEKAHPSPPQKTQ